MRLQFLLIALATGAISGPIAAQQPSAAQTATIELDDSTKIKPSPELQKSLDELAAAVQALALRVANDPQLRAAAIQVAAGFVATAQHVVTEQSVVIEDALRKAADRIATVQGSEKRNPKRNP